MSIIIHTLEKVTLSLLMPYSLLQKQRVLTFISTTQLEQVKPAFLARPPFQVLCFKISIFSGSLVASLI